MSFKIAFKKSVGCDFKKIDRATSDRILKRIENELPTKAESFPRLSGKFSGLRKFRINDYRVIFTIIEDTVLILRVSHRREAYK